MIIGVVCSTLAAVATERSDYGFTVLFAMIAIGCWMDGAAEAIKDSRKP